MEVKLMPENKTFFLLVVGLIGLLAIFQVLRTVSWKVATSNESTAYSEMRSLVAREMGIRKRHAQLVKASAGWERQFLAGTAKEANLTLLGQTEEWADLCGITYESVQIAADDSAAKEATVTIRGNSDFYRIHAFLRRVEEAEFAVSVTAVRLKKENSSEGIRYELTLHAPLMRSGGERG